LKYRLLSQNLINILKSRYNLNFFEFIKDLIELAQKDEISLAVWRYPNEKHFSAVLSFDVAFSKTLDLQQDCGFALGDFLSEGRKAHFINADIFINSENGSLSLKTNKYFEDKLIKLLQKEHQSGHDRNKSNNNYFSKDDFIKSVEKAVQSIKNKQFKKVVLARRKEVDLNSGFNCIDSLQKMSKNYSTAFISYVCSKPTGEWIGATPEVLLSIADKRHFKTVSLAGTQAATSVGVKEAVWKQKEIEEQALVTRYIINCFKRIRLREYEDIGPRTIQAANLYHLCTDFYADMLETNYPNLGNQMLELLHPTSAVCGMPKIDSLTFINEIESFKRSLYSGFLGPVNIENKSHLAVNLRCAQLQKGKAILYAGVGITEDSDPEKEWKETEIKFETMSSVL